MSVVLASAPTDVNVTLLNQCHRFVTVYFFEPEVNVSREEVGKAIFLKQK